MQLLFNHVCAENSIVSCCVSLLRRIISSSQSLGHYFTRFGKIKTRNKIQPIPYRVGRSSLFRTVTSVRLCSVILLQLKLSVISRLNKFLITLIHTILLTQQLKELTERVSLLRIGLIVHRLCTWWWYSSLHHWWHSAKWLYIYIGMQFSLDCAR